MAGVVRSAASHRSAPASLIAFAVVALAFGVLVYLADRPAGSAALLPWTGLRSGAPLFGVLGGWLPSLAHAFAFALLTAATVHPASAPPYWACVLWWSIDVAFEAAQAAPWKASIAHAVRRGGDDAWLPALLARYVERGTFDWSDVVAATAGALAAAAVITLVWRQEDRHV